MRYFWPRKAHFRDNWHQDVLQFQNGVNVNLQNGKKFYLN